VAASKADLAQTRPAGAHALIADDLPNEDGVPNHAPEGTRVDNHDILTGSDRNGRLYAADWSHTCHDWTSAVGSDGLPRVGHSWTRAGGIGGGPGGGGGVIIGGEPPEGGPPPPGRPPLPDGGPMGILGAPPDGGGMGFSCRRFGDTDDAGCTGDGDGDSWISTLDEAGCAPGVDLVEKGPPDPDNPTVGSGGGYGAIYCLALRP